MTGTKKVGFPEAKSDTLESIKMFIANYIYIDPDKSLFIQSEFLDLHSLDCVIFEGDIRDQYMCPYATELSDLANRSGLSEATYSHFSQGSEWHYDISLDHSGFEWFEDKFYGPSLCIIEKSHNMVIVSDADYYWCLAARPDFIKEYIDLIGDSHLLTFEAATIYERSDDHVVAQIGRNLAKYLALYNKRSV